MRRGLVDKSRVLVRTLVGTRADWRLVRPPRPRTPRVDSTWSGPLIAVSTIVVGWFAFADAIGDGNAPVALFVGSVSITMMAWSNILSTRVAPLERAFGGLDRMYRWHRWFGALSVGAMWLHMQMVDDVKGVRGASRSVAKAAEELAETGSTLLYVLVGISLLRWFPTRWWRWTHKAMVVPYAIACWHFYTATKPYANDSPWGSWFTAFMVLGLAAWVHRVVWRDMIRRGSAHSVVRVDAVGNTVTIELAPVGRPLRHRPGQFAFLKADVPGLREPHPFTIASAPDEPVLRFVVRDLGDWTNRLLTGLAVGDRVVVEGPYGRLDPEPTHPVDHVVWVAGGVGITPFLAAATSRRPGVDPTPHLFFCVPSRVGAPCLDDLETAASDGRIHLHVHASDEGNRLSSDDVLSVLRPDHGRTAHVVMCGPASLVNTLRAELRQHGIDRTHVEAFDIRGAFGPDLSKPLETLVDNGRRRVRSAK